MTVRSRRIRTVPAAAGALALAGAATAGLLLAGLSHAATTTDCAGLQSAIINSHTGDTIVLSDPGGLCVITTPIIVSQNQLTIEGAPGTTSGFDGQGAQISGLTATGVDGLTLDDLTFQNFSAGAVSITSSVTATHPVVISGDTFANDAVSGTDAVEVGGGLSVTVAPANVGDPCRFSGPAVSVQNSMFNQDSVTNTNTAADHALGGGAYLDVACATGSTGTISLSGNMFTGDYAISSGQAAGGGLALDGLEEVGGHPDSEAQAIESDDAFTLNSVFDGAATTSDGQAAGGGEYTQGVDLTSTGDEFTRNGLSAPHHFSGGDTTSYGAGLATFHSACTNAARSKATLVDDVFTLNSIGAPANGAAAGEGAAVYAGCGGVSPGVDVTLQDTTVTDNTAGGAGVGGLDGESGDTLTLEDSILYGDAGAEIGGFGSTSGANATATFSDVCALGGSGTVPYAGTGNICAGPALAGPTDGAFDVHETAGSPTIDAGSNALVPAGLTTDFFGEPREQAGNTGAAGTVDIGAAEYSPSPSRSTTTSTTSSATTAATSSATTVATTSTTSTSARPASSGSSSTTSTTTSTAAPTAVAGAGTLSVSTLVAHAGAVKARLACAGSSLQTCTGAVVMRTVLTVRGGQTVAVTAAAGRARHRTVTVGAHAVRLAGGSSTTLSIRLNRTGRALAARFGRLPVRAVVRQGATLVLSRRLSIPPPAKVTPARPARR